MSVVSHIGEDPKSGRTVRSMAARKQQAAGKSKVPPTLRNNKWSLSNLPPEGNADVGAFFYQLYEDGLRERNRLGIPARFQSYYQLFRGRHTQDALHGVFTLKRKSRLSIALLHANVTRTVANITARAPVAEVSQADGLEDEADQILSEKMRIWNAREEQQVTLAKSVLNMEVYGITIEKAVYDSESLQGKTIPLDPLSVIPAPGYYDTLNDCPYVCHIFQMPIELAEKKYNTEGVEESDELHDILGLERQEEFVRTGYRSGATNYPGNYVPTSSPAPDQRISIRNALIIEIWIRDTSTEKREIMEVVRDEETGQEVAIMVEKDVLKYPGGIRMVTITNNGHLVLTDRRNPNVNKQLPLEVVSNTYLCNTFPFFKANSYEDTSSIWGYPMVEVVGAINLEVDELWSSIINYLKMAMYPPLILPRDTNVDKSAIRYVPRLVIQPSSTATSQGIRWLNMPTPPSWMFEALNQLIGFFDRISQIEDADRGSAPGQVIAASAIEMLQERGAVLVRAKIRAVDYLVRERGRCFISFYQNFGVQQETINTSHGSHYATGIEFIHRKFNYLVESGSTVARTSSQVRQEAVELYQMHAIDRQSLLQQINFPDWQRIVERMGETELQAAIQILVQAGLDQDVARELYNYLIQDQGGPGDVSRLASPGGNFGEGGAPARPGTPKANQGGA
jgi:hypothetical protein